jgi:prefoldin subunit 5
MSERDIAELTRLLGTAIQNIGEMRREMNQRFEKVDQRFDNMQEEMNQRFDKVDNRLEKIEYQMKIMASDIIQLRAEDARLYDKIEKFKDAA